MNHRLNPWGIFQAGQAVLQGLMRLVGAGAILFGAHQLFLRYYAREWAAIQFTGPNGCIGEDMIANGDLIGGQTFCNRPENFAPWIEVYKNHPLAAVTYYGAGAILIFLIGIIWHLLQRRRVGETPFGAPPPLPHPVDSEHLR